MGAKAVSVLISGRVQGVFYRHWTRERAHRLGVAGWIRNRFDGRVEGFFEGPEDAVNDLVAACRQGPPGAVVEAVEVHSVAAAGANGFEIRSSA